MAKCYRGSLKIKKLAVCVCVFVTVKTSCIPFPISGGQYYSKRTYSNLRCLKTNKKKQPKKNYNYGCSCVHPPCFSQMLGYVSNAGSHIHSFTFSRYQSTLIESVKRDLTGFLIRICGSDFGKSQSNISIGNKY